MRVLVVREHHAMPDEHVVLDRHALAKERVRRDLAATSDLDALLDLDERTDTRLIADLAAIRVDERIDLDVVAELNVIQPNAVFAQVFVGERGAHRYNSIASPPFMIDSVEASRTRTTFRPAWPSVMGVLSSRMQSMKCRVAVARASVWSSFGESMSPVRYWT